jgi:hypothetical protein
MTMGFGYRGLAVPFSPFLSFHSDSGGNLGKL